LIKQYSLTRQEIKVVELLLQHLSNGEIAGELFIEKKTVQNHLNNIKTKLGFKNVAELRKN
jgi:DNA-binding CsgD family transcriptional regulator